MVISDWSSDVCSSDLAKVQAKARADGMAIGLLADLAVGVHTGGADSWQSAQQPYRHTAPILRRTPQAFWQWGPPSPKAAIWSDRHISLMSTIGTQPGPSSPKTP